MMDIIKQAQLRELAINSLLPIGGRRRSDSILICCPWHSEKKPSLNVHVGHKIIPGSFQCFGCGAKGNWNDLAKALRLPMFDFRDATPAVDSEEFSLLVRQVIEDIKVKTAAKEIRVLKGTEELPDYFMWRGYTGKFYKRFGAQYYWNRNTDRNYLYFPLYMNGEYLGYTLCNLDGKDSEKYQIFAESKKVFFLYDYVVGSEPIVIVEGHFDALRLWAEGISALAIFGIKNWSNVKKSYLLTKHPPKVVIAFDGDKAGYDAAVNIWKDIKLSYHNVDIYYLPYQPSNKLDPGNMPDEHLMGLRRMLYAE